MKVPTLDEAIQTLRELELFLFLEVKASNPLVREMKKYMYLDLSRVCFVSDHTRPIGVIPK